MATSVPDQLDFDPKNSNPPNEIHPQSSPWREKAESFFSHSSSKFKIAASKVTVAAESAGMVMKTKWQNTKEEWNNNVQPRMESGLGTAAQVAAETTSKIKKAILDTTGSVQPRMESSLEAAKKLASETKNRIHRGLSDSRTSISKTNGSNLNLSWRFGMGFDKMNQKRNAILERIGSQRNPGSVNSVFGLPLELVIERQENKKVSYVVEKCIDFLLDHEQDIDCENIFFNEGNQDNVMRLIRIFDNNPKATIPLNSTCLDVSNLLLTYVKCLPEPLLTFDLYDALVLQPSVDFAIWKTLLSRIPIINLFTLQCIVALLSFMHNKTENTSCENIAGIWAPLLVWRKGMPTIASQKHMEEEEGEKDKNIDSVVIEKDKNVSENQGEDAKIDNPVAESGDIKEVEGKEREGKEGEEKEGETKEGETKEGEEKEKVNEDEKSNGVKILENQVADNTTNLEDEEKTKISGNDSPDHAYAPCYAAPGEKLKAFLSFSSQEKVHGVENDDEEKEHMMLIAAISCLIKDQNKIFVDLIPNVH